MPQDLQVYATPPSYSRKIGLRFDGAMAFWQPGQITIGSRATPNSKAAEASFLAQVCDLAIRPATRPVVLPIYSLDDIRPRP